MYRKILVCLIAIVVIVLSLGFSLFSSKPTDKIAKKELQDRLNNENIPADIVKFEYINGRDTITKDGTKGYVMNVQADVLFKKEAFCIILPGSILFVGGSNSIVDLERTQTSKNAARQSGNVIKSGYYLELDADKKARYNSFIIAEKGAMVKMKYYATFMKTDKGWIAVKIGNQ